LSAERIGVGDRFPSFTLPDQSGKSFALDDVLGKGAVVLFFYPKDGTAGCTREACSFRDASADFLEAGAVVAGISSDDSASHERFAAQHGLSYPLLADLGGALRKRVGVPRSMLGLVEGRVTYVLDSQGVVRHVFDSMLGVNKHVEEALVTARGLGGAR
jgi:peroxiredoxin Q/BCP